MLDYLVYTPTWTDNFTWLLAVAFIFAFLVSYGMGANDSCNDWGPAVGAGTVKIWQAYILCGIFNTIGAILLGYKVTETLRSGIVEFQVFDVYSQYNHTAGAYQTVPFCDNATAIEGFAGPQLGNGSIVECAKYTSADFMIGQTAAMAGVAAFMIVSSVYKIPVSATHAIVGGSLASSLYLRGNVGIKWMEIAGIVVSWFISPIIAGFFAGAFYIIIKYTVLIRKDTFRWALNLCPVFMGFTLTVNLFACIYDGSKYLGFDKLSVFQALAISLTTGVLGCLILMFPLRGWLTRRAQRLFDSEQRKNQIKLESGVGEKKSKVTDMKTPETDMEKIHELPWYKCLWTAVPEDRLTTKVFNALQIVSSSLLSFSHGANDTANTVGPLLAVWMTYQTGYAFGAAETRNDSQALLAFGAIAMIVGFVTLGHRTIKLIAKEITVDMSPVSGFAIELGTAFTVLVCVKIGIPISSTHCAVGAVLFVGLAKSTSEGVSFATFRKICIVWLLCFPVSAAISLVVTVILTHFV